ncbi:MAG: DUF2442 domain-containing protein [Thermoguttaceae bacterium]|jgi:hypothetical protein
MNPRVSRVQPKSGHRLLLTFTNGEKGVFHCRPLLEFGVFRELQDEAYFRQARVEGGTVVWPHEQDICPDTLYLESDKSAEEIQEYEDLKELRAAKAEEASEPSVLLGNVKKELGL